MIRLHCDLQSGKGYEDGSFPIEWSRCGRERGSVRPIVGIDERPGRRRWLFYGGVSSGRSVPSRRVGGNESEIASVAFHCVMSVQVAETTTGRKYATEHDVAVVQDKT